jgi:aspartyl aminopeptidase
LLGNQLDVNPDSILDYDLSLYINEPGQFIGINKEIIKAPRIDNLAMAYASMMAITEDKRDKGINVVACFDNEEVGSKSKQGVDSSLLRTIMERIFHAYDKTTEQYLRVLPNSFFVSADGAYAVHPNHTDKNDPTNQCEMNKGVTIKMNANRSYATDTETAAVFQQLCAEIDIPVQKYVNHSDMLGGKSIGSMIESQIGIRGVDVGAPMLAMHSAMEYVGTDDLYDSYQVFKHYLS